jgi:hypothetical protein
MWQRGPGAEPAFCNIIFCHDIKADFIEFNKKLIIAGNG